MVPLVESTARMAAAVRSVPPTPIPPRFFGQCHAGFVLISTSKLLGDCDVCGAGGVELITNCQSRPNGTSMKIGYITLAILFE